MGKEIKIKIKDVQNLEFELLENANKGDFINLRNLNEVDFSILEKNINEKLDKVYEKKLYEAKSIWENNFMLNDNRYTDLVKQKNEYQKEIEVLQKNFNTQLDNKRLEIEKNYQEIINQLKNQIDIEINAKQHEIEKTKLSVITQTQNQINNLQNQITLLEQTKQKDLDNQKLSIEKQYIEQINKLNFDHQNEIDNLKRARGFNSKTIGEDFEIWINNEFNNWNLLDEDCVLEKTNKVIDNTKPDFLFKVLDKTNNGELVSVTIEAKTKDMYANTNKKNHEFFDKLQKDKNNYHSQYALLITELEETDDFLIKKAQNYENMYMVRPQYFIFFLAVIKTIYLKEKAIKLSETNLKKKQEIINEFETLKNNILDITLKNIFTNVEEIIKKSESIKKDAEKIYDIANNTLKKHLETIKNKISDFKISKIANELDSLA